ncbi:hypothetical protein RB4090 [Rhodopirellula baltica SH 1]|uniref:Uncharacterized protein n=3 Tax=Rhodopirellula baltica TaxID=265606 RepID=Q7UT60_RHOBA|nr:hypothetical protein RB4090 [Rhodopirellula baltica SH 1]
MPMAERRDAAAALEMTPAFDSFIRTGVSNEEPATNDQPEKLPKPGQTMSERKTGKRKPKVAGQRKERRPTDFQQDSPEFARTHGDRIKFRKKYSIAGCLGEDLLRKIA